MNNIITLSKDETADLDGITDLVVGASWDDGTGMQGRIGSFINRKRGCDLDLMGVFFQNGEPVRYAGFDNNEPFENGSVRHSGDARNGRASGDDESVEVKLTALPSIVDKVVFFVAAFKHGTDFALARNISFNVYDATGGSVDKVAEIMPSLRQTGNAHRVATVTRRAGGWDMRVDDVRGEIPRGNIPGLYTFASR
jgi:stress response protein SCP2